MKKSSDVQLPSDSNEVTLKSGNNKQSYILQIIPWVDLHCIVIQDKSTATLSNDVEIDSSTFTSTFLKTLFREKLTNQSLGEEYIDTKTRKSLVKDYLLKNQLTVREDANGNLIVHDLVTILSPYMPINCEGTNQIVLDRIRNLITQFDSKKE